MATGNRHLVWCNRHDADLGEVNFKGDNLLGRALVAVRSDVNAKIDHCGWARACLGVTSEGGVKPKLIVAEIKEHLHKNTNLAEDGDPMTTETLIKSHSIVLTTGLAVLGKLPNCTIVAMHPSVSRQHALICLSTNGDLWLADLGSKGGTYLNDERLELAYVGVRVYPDDCVRLGHSTRYYRIDLDTSEVVADLETKQSTLRDEIKKLSSRVIDPLGLLDKHTTEVFVSNLPFKTTSTDIETFFLGCLIKTVTFPTKYSDSDGTTAEKGCAVVSFDDEATTQRALSLDGRPFGGRNVKVALADLKTRDTSTKRNPPPRPTDSSGYHPAEALMGAHGTREAVTANDSDDDASRNNRRYVDARGVPERVEKRDGWDIVRHSSDDSQQRGKHNRQRSSEERRRFGDDDRYPDGGRCGYRYGVDHDTKRRYSPRRRSRQDRSRSRSS
eukprot:Lankesteria_metandrocarpae@DN4679_c0_g1_i1.p1